MGKDQTKIKDVIDASVKAAIAAMIVENKNHVDDAYKATLRRLEALQILKDRIEDNTERLAGLKENGVQEKSKSIVRFSASGVRADPMEMYDAVLADMEAHLAADQEEVDTVMRALEYVKGDYYYDTVYGKFVENLPDDQIASKLFCDDSTVRRHRGRLVHRIAVYLYGAAAL